MPLVAWDELYEDLSCFPRDATATNHHEVERCVDGDGHGPCYRFSRATLTCQRVTGSVSARWATLKGSCGGPVSRSGEPVHRRVRSLSSRHSDCLGGRCALEATRGSNEEAQSTLHRSTGVSLAKRLAEELASRGVPDVETFYKNARRELAERAEAGQTSSTAPSGPGPPSEMPGSGPANCGRSWTAGTPARRRWTQLSPARSPTAPAGPPW